VSSATRPEWVYPGDDLHLNDLGWHDVYVGIGGNEDQAGLVFIKIDDPDEEGVAGLSIDEATALRNYLNGWIAWATDSIGVT
jgi:hypothetical protein